MVTRATPRGVQHWPVQCCSAVTQKETFVGSLWSGRSSPVGHGLLRDGAHTWGESGLSLQH